MKLLENKDCLNLVETIVIALDSKGNVTLVNRKGCKVLGYKEKDILGKNWFDNFIPESDRPSVKGVFKKLIKGQVKPVEYYENLIITRSGEKLVSWHNSILENENGRIIGIIGSGDDITERKKMEEELREGEKRYKRIFEVAGNGILIVDYTGKVIDLNKKMSDMHGYTREEMLGTDSIKYVHPDSYDSFKEFFKRVKNKGTFYSEEKDLKKDGSVVPIEVTGTSINYKNKDCLLAIISDITERKEAENKVKESEKKLKSLLEINPDPLVIVKINGKISYVNSSLLNILGCKKDDVVGKNVLNVKFISDDSKSRITKDMALFQKGIAGERRYKVDIITNSGERKILELNSADIEQDGKIDSWLLSFRDLTDIEKEKGKINEERNQFLSMFDGMEEIVYVADPKTYEMLYMNPSAKKNWNWVPGQKCYEVLQNAKKPCLFCSNDKIFGKSFGKTYIWEFRNLVNKRWYKCIDRAIKWPDGRDVRFEMAIDITDQKNTEEKIRNNERFLNSILDNIPLMVFVKDSKDLKFELFNKAGEDLLGQKKNDLIGKSDYDFFPKEQAEFFIGKDREVLKNKKLVDIQEEPIETPSGKRILRTKKIPILNKNGVAEHLLGISEDITEIKESEEEVLKFNRLAIDRELKMVELKQEVNGLLKQLNEKPKYKTNESA